MSKRVGVINFKDAISEILSKYKDENVELYLEKGLNDTMNEARKAVRQGSPKGSTGKYRSGWQKKITRSRTGSFKAIVYNGGSHGSLTHLLEKGHYLRNGKFLPGKPHIEPVNDEAQKQIMEYLEFNLGNGGLKFV